MSFRKVTLIISMFCLVGCGPVYKTFYEYTPPKTDTGNKCIEKCGVVKKKCLDLTGEFYNLCENINASTVDANMMVKSSTSFYRNYGPASPSVKKDCVYERNLQKNQCLADYRSCYELCGGAVETAERCVKNCNGK